LAASEPQASWHRLKVVLFALLHKMTNARWYAYLNRESAASSRRKRRPRRQPPSTSCDRCAYMHPSPERTPPGYEFRSILSPRSPVRLAWLQAQLVSLHAGGWPALGGADDFDAIVQSYRQAISMTLDWSGSDKARVSPALPGWLHLRKALDWAAFGGVSRPRAGAM